MMFCLGKLRMHQANGLAFNLRTISFKNILQLFNGTLNSESFVDKIKMDIYPIIEY